MSDFRDLISALTKQTQTSSVRIIGIDGASGVGKTTLAHQLQKEIGGVVISIDDFVEQHQQAYFSSIQWERLIASIETLRSSTQFLILDGVSLVKVLERLAMKPDYLIYVRRVNEFGDWSDDWLCEEDRDLNATLARIDRMEKVPGTGNLDREIAEYHNKYKPLRKAQYVFDRTE